MTIWTWVDLQLVEAIHHRQIAEHGGQQGVRDQGAIESALARPQNLAAYVQPDLAALAAAYGYGLARNHGFADGNKRTAWVTLRLFIRLNSGRLAFEPIDAIRTVEGVAAGTISEEGLANWLRSRLD